MKKKLTIRSAVGIVTLCMTFVSSATSSFGAEWDGGGTNSAWGTTTNWVGDVVPDNDGSANVTLTGNVQPNVLLDSAQNINSLTGSVNDVDFALSGDDLSLQGGGVVKTGSKNLIFNNQVIIASNQSWVVEDGGLIASSNVVLDGTTVTLDGRGGSGVQLNGVVSGSGGLVVTGNVASVLTGANTYGGGTAINDGTLSINNNDALGTGTVSLNDGTLGTDSSLTLGNDVSITSGNNTLDTGGNNSSLNGILSGSGNLAVTGGGSLSLTEDNIAYSGTTTVHNATVVGIASDTALGTGQVVLDDGTLKTEANVALDNNIAIASGNGTIDTEGNSSTFNGTLSGSGKLSVEGGGSVSLTADNSGFSEWVTVRDASTVGIASDTALGTGLVRLDDGTLRTDSNVTIGNNINIQAGDGTIDTSGKNSTLDGTVSGFGNLTVTGGGSISLTANNSGSFFGTTTIQDGSTVGINSGNALSSEAVVLNDGVLRANADVTVGNNITVAAGGGKINNNGNTAIFSGDITGVGDVNLVGGGTNVLSGNNSYLGNTRLQTGSTLVAGSSTAISDSSAVELSTSSTVLLDGNDQTIAGLSGAGRVDLGGGASLNVVLANNTNYIGKITGDGTLIKDGTGVLTLNNGANSYSGGTTINGGAISISSDKALGDSAGDLTLNSGTLKVTGNASAVRDAALLAGGGTIEVANTKTYTLDGNVSGVGGLSKTGSGTMILGGNNSYQGGTVISGGVLRVSNDANLGDAAGGVTIHDSKLEITQSDTFGRDFTLASGTATLDVAEYKNAELSGAVDGSGDLTKTGLGQLGLSGNNTFSGDLAILEGTLAVDGNANLGSATTAISMSNGGTLRTRADINSTRDFAVTGSGGFKVDSSTTHSVGGDISGSGALSVNGGGTLVVDGANTFEGTVTVSGNSLLSIDSVADFGHATNNVVLSSGGLKITENLTIDRDLQLGSGINSGSGRLEVAAGKTATIVNGIYGSYSDLYKSGEGTLVLNSTDLYHDDTRVQAGTLRMDVGDALANSGGNYYSGGYLSVDSGAVVDLNNNNQNLGYLYGSGKVEMGTADLSVKQGDFSGDINGSGSLTHTAGSLYLSGSNTYSGGTIVNSGGDLVFQNADAVPASGINSIIMDSTSYVGAGFAIDQAFLNQFNKASSSGVIGLNADSANDLNLTGFNAGTRLGSHSSAVLSGDLTPQGSTYLLGGRSGTLEISSDLTDGTGTRSLDMASGSLVLSGTNSYSGGTVIASDGNVLFTTEEALPDAGTINNSGYAGVGFAIDQSFLDQFDKANSDGVIGVDMDSANNLDLTGFAGEARLGTRSTATLSGQITSGSSLRLGGGGGNLTVSSVIDGDREVDVGYGRTILTGANTFSNGVVVGYNSTLRVDEDANLGYSAGGITLNHYGQLEMGGSFTNSRTVTLNGRTGIDTQSNDLGLAGAVSGSGELRKYGSGTLTLSNATYTGNTYVSSGTLKVTGASVLNANANMRVSGTLDIDGTSQSIRTLEGGGNIDLDSDSAAGDLTITAAYKGGFYDNFNSYSGDISGDGSVKITGGTQIFSGESTYTGGTTVDDATLQINKSAALGDESGSLTLKNGATLTTTASLSSSRAVVLENGNNTINTYSFAPAGEVAEFSGTVSGNGGLIKTGSEKLKLSGAVDHTGATAVNAGTLEIALSAHVSASDITISSGATLELQGSLGSAVDVQLSGRLQGSGSSAGSVTVTSGGLLAPGNSPGTLTFADLTLESGGIYEWELQDATAGAGTGWDFLSVTDTLTVNSTGLDPFIIKILTLDELGDLGEADNWDTAINYTWNIASAISWVNADTNLFSLDLSGVVNETTGAFEFAFSGSNLQLKYIANPVGVPEPGTLGLLGLSTFGLLFRRRRMRRGNRSSAGRRDPFGFSIQEKQVEVPVGYVNPIKPRITSKERARAQWLNY